MKIIDLETFPRRSHYEFFKSYAYPYMGMTANVDITNLYAAAKEPVETFIAQPTLPPSQIMPVTVPDIFRMA